MKNQIYKLKNIVNNKIYIGLTTQGAWDRYLNHLSEARCGSKWPIHRAIRKYGKENFELIILYTLEDNQNPKELYELEKYYIKIHNSNDRSIGYNLTEGGEGSFGIKRSQEWKDKRKKTQLTQVANGTYKICNYVKVKLTNLNNNEVTIFESIKSCASYVNTTSKTLRSKMVKNLKYKEIYTFEKLEKFPCC